MQTVTRRRQCDTLRGMSAKSANHYARERLRLELTTATMRLDWAKMKAERMGLPRRLPNSSKRPGRNATV